MTDDLDLGLDLGELEPVNNVRWQKTPVVYISKCGKFVTFNRAAEQLVKGRRLAISHNSEYIVFTPTHEHFGYRLTTSEHSCAHLSAITLTRQFLHLKGKHFKLYKSGERFAIKRYEPLEDV